MRTQNAKLVFEKRSITELNDRQTHTIIGGGSGIICSNCIPDPISDKLRTGIQKFD